MGNKKVVGTKEAAQKAGVSERRIRALLAQNRVVGAEKLAEGGAWAIPLPVVVLQAPRSHAHKSVIKMRKAPKVKK